MVRIIIEFDKKEEAENKMEEIQQIIMKRDPSEEPMIFIEENTNS